MHAVITAAARVVMVVVVSGCLLLGGHDARADRMDVVGESASEEVAGLIAGALDTLSSMSEGPSRQRFGGSQFRDNVRWTWPMAGPQVAIHLFDGPSKRWLPGHRGVDLAGFGGSTVRSVAACTESYSGEINGVGIVSVLHPDGLLSTYQPVLEPPARGSSVRRGGRLGSLDSQGSHCWPLNCLHLGARMDQDYLDPMLLLRPWEVSLLPTGRAQARG